MYLGTLTGWDTHLVLLGSPVVHADPTALVGMDIGEHQVGPLGLVGLVHQEGLEDSFHLGCLFHDSLVDLVELFHMARIPLGCDIVLADMVPLVGLVALLLVQLGLVFQLVHLSLVVHLAQAVSLVVLQLDHVPLVILVVHYFVAFSLNLLSAQLHLKQAGK